MPKRDRTLFEPEPPVWKIKDIIDKLGGVGAITEKLMAKGFSRPVRIPCRAGPRGIASRAHGPRRYSRWRRTRA